MKAIINGKRYNTETATEVASDGYGLPNDFRSWEEVLYLTPRGNWFLWGKGGPMTKYRQDTGNGWTGGSRIIPLSPDGSQGVA